jgi:FkbM family methyltransferase
MANNSPYGAIATRLANFAAWLERFLVATVNFGTLSAILLLVVRRGRSFPGGVPIFVKKLGRKMYYRGASDIGVMSHFFRPNYRILDTPEMPVKYIIDAGANIGDETLRFRYFHPDATIVALEPESENFRLLSRNLAGYDRVVLLQNGLWSHECDLHVIPSVGDHNEAFRVEEVSGTGLPAIHAVTVPVIMDRYGFPEIDILKLDIEGAEYFVFDSQCQEWVGRVRVFIFECPDNDRAGTAFRIFGALGSHQFNCFIQGESLVLIRRDTPWSVESNRFLDR